MNTAIRQQIAHTLYGVETMVPPITATGYCHDTSYASPILTQLIQDTGRFTERYASDLFIDWQSVERALNDDTPRTEVHLFGIRRDGVDGDALIIARMRDPAVYGTLRNTYRRLYALHIEVVHDEYMPTNKVTMTLKNITDGYLQTKELTDILKNN